MKFDEHILVVPRSELLWAGPFRGVSTDGLDEYLARIKRFGTFRRRRDVEDDPSLKQIIPYLLVRCGGRHLLFQRTQTGHEGRLRGLSSVGVGGHISQEDVGQAEDVVTAGLRRELEEELYVTGDWTARLVGVLNDDDNPVGQVHFGLVHRVDVVSGHVEVRETDQLTGHLVPLDDVRAAYPQMETWSQLVVDSGVMTL